MDCVTPSHPEAIPHGESLNIYDLLLRQEARLDPSLALNSPHPLWHYNSRRPVLSGVSQDWDYLAAQIGAGDRQSTGIYNSRPRKLTTQAGARAG
jgi:DNA polymerase gamma 1